MRSAEGTIVYNHSMSYPINKSQGGRGVMAVGAPRTDPYHLAYAAYVRMHPTKPIPERVQLHDCVRLVIFNTRGLSVREVWSELANVLDDGMLAAVLKLKRVVYQNRNPRMDMWVRSDASSHISRVVREMTRRRSRSVIEAFKELGFVRPEFRDSVVSSWRLSVYENWHDRGSDSGSLKLKKGSLTPQYKSIGCWNVNGLRSRQLELVELLAKEMPVVFAIQETLVTSKEYPFRVQGYVVYSALKRKGFRGQCLLVRDEVASYEVPHKEKYKPLKDYVIHVKISKLGGLIRPVHVLAVYMPSGGNFRSIRSNLLKLVVGLGNEILRKDPSVSVILLGDFNTSEKEMDKKDIEALVRLKPIGSSATYFPKGIAKSSIDHILIGGGIREIMKSPEILPVTTSDHRPVRCKFDFAQSDGFQPARRTFRIQQSMIKRDSEQVVNDNRWACLEEEMSASESAIVFEETSIDILTDAAILVPSSTPRNRFPNKLRRLIKRVRCLEKRNRKGDAARLAAAKVTLREATSKWERKAKTKFAASLAEDSMKRDYKSLWNRIRNATSPAACQSVQPIRVGNELKTKPSDILKATAQHYKNIAQYDPQNRIKDDDYWNARDLGEELPELQGINDNIAWKEVIVAIRGMRVNTSPGQDMMHVNVLKMLVLEECMAQIQKETPEFRRQDDIRVDLPSEQMCQEPLTPMGKTLFKLLNRVWSDEQVPAPWEQVTMVNLPKPGAEDLENLDNYRGISLISVTLKILLTILANRLYDACEGAGLISREQAGFRKREEAIAQFIAMQEVVRRRFIKGQTTFGIFIDFKKAYDRVQHKAMFRVLKHLGIRGKLFNFLMHMYLNSFVSVKSGGHYSNVFHLLRGTRQGCPISPLLFILFINFVLKDIPGVTVPGCGEDIADIIDLCKGGMYADDVLVLTEATEETQTVIEVLEEWGLEWDMELGLPKCGVMCWTPSEAVRAAYEEVEFTIGAGIFPKVDKYKYLGIWIDHTFPKSRDPMVEGNRPLEMEFALFRAEKARNRLHQLKPILFDRLCPIPVKVEVVRSLVISVMTYGAEWIAFRQTHAAPYQRVVKTAARWILGNVGKKNLYAELPVCYELGLPSMEVVLCSLRTRLWAKLTLGEEKLKTWIQWLSHDPPKLRARTWVTLNDWWINTATCRNHYLDLEDERPNMGMYKYSGNIAEHEAFVREREDGSIEYQTVEEQVNRVGKDPLRPWVIRGRMAEMHMRSNAYSSPYLEQLLRERVGRDREGVLVPGNSDVSNLRGIDIPPPDLTHERRLMIEGRISAEKSTAERLLVNDVSDCVLERLMTADRSEAWKWYDKYRFGVTRDFIRSTTARPDLAEGVRWLTLIRTRTFPRVNDRFIALTFKGKTPQFRKDKCPICGGSIKSGWEWAHLVVACNDAFVKHVRATTVGEEIESIKRSLLHPGAKRLSDTITGLGLQSHLMGAVAIYLVGGVVKDQYDLVYHHTFGHLPLSQDKGMGWVFIASFLQRVVPRYTLKLFDCAYGSHLKKKT
jgi:exonuclease III